MKLRVGSINPVKVEAVKECFPDWEIVAVAADSGIQEQPMTLEETIRGSRNRAQSHEPGWGIGIESGIMPIERASSGWMNTIACSIWTGERFCLGLAGGFVVPQAIMDIIHKESLRDPFQIIDLSEASRRAGLTTEKRVGYGAGIVSLLTDGKMARKPYIKQAIEMAMIQVNHPELF